MHSTYIAVYQKTKILELKGALTVVSMTTFYGGGEEYLVRLINCLQQELDIHLVCCSKLLQEKLKSAKVNVQYVQGSTVARYIKVWGIVMRVRSKPLRVLLLNGQGPIYLAPLVPKLFKKVVYVHHTAFEYYNSSTKNLLIKFCLQKVDRIISVSNFLKSELQRFTSKVPVTVIYNWLPETSVKQVSYNAFEGPLNLIYIARLVEVKGIIPLVEAVLKVENVELYILGDGPLYNTIFKNYSNQPSVKIMGWQNELFPFVQKAHLNVVNSFSEGYSYTPVEVGICGVPSLISDLDVHKEISDGGKYSFLFKTGSVENLVEKITYLNENRHVLAEMSERCKQHFINKFVQFDYKEQYLKELR